MQAPIQRLPDELLSTIFNFCLPESPCFKPDCVPLLLTQVCSDWRRVAFASHELWTRLVLNKDNLGCQDFMSLLYMWLQSSDERLLDVDVDLTRLNIRTLQLTVDKMHARQKTYENLMAALYPEFWRIRSLQGLFPMYVATGLALNKMKALEKLNLVGVSDFRAESERTLIDLSEPLPHLKMLTLDGFPVNLRSLYNQTQLTRIELAELKTPSGLNSQEAASLLSALPNLKVASLNLNRSEDNTLPPILTRVELPELRYLYINWEDVSDPRAFFGALLAPKLERLCLLGTLYNAPGSWDALRGFVQANANASPGGKTCLKRLSIGDTGAVDLYLADILEVSPALEYLCINYGLVSPPLLRALIWEGQTPAQQLVPRLSTLRIGGCQDFADEHILPVVVSRACMLKEVALRQCAGLRVENEKYLRAAGVPDVVLDSDKTVLAPFGGLFFFSRVTEDVAEFLKEEWAQ